jgi:hypothetical protein
MKLIKSLGVLLAITALFAITAGAATTNAPVATATPTLGPWTLSVEGGGSTALTGDKDSVVGATFELGHNGKFIVPFVGGLRQSVGWEDSDGANWKFGTKLFADVPVLKLGKNVQLDVGGNAGILYGNCSPEWTISPEVVTRLYLKKDVDVYLRVEYQYNLTTGKSQDTLVYGIGLRIRF